jgi:hypothetical protein
MAAEGGERSRVPLQADDGRVAGLAVERAVVLGELAGLERLGTLLALEAVVAAAAIEHKMQRRSRVG